MDVSSANVAAARIATAEAVRVVAAALDACAGAGDWKEFAGDAVRSVIADAVLARRREFECYKPA